MLVREGGRTILDINLGQETRGRYVITNNHRPALKCVLPLSLLRVPFRPSIFITAPSSDVKLHEKQMIFVHGTLQY